MTLSAESSVHKKKSHLHSNFRHKTGVPGFGSNVGGKHKGFFNSHQIPYQLKRTDIMGFLGEYFLLEDWWEEISIFVDYHFVLINCWSSVVASVVLPQLCKSPLSFFPLFGVLFCCTR